MDDRRNPAIALLTTFYGHPGRHSVSCQGSFEFRLQYDYVHRPFGPFEAFRVLEFAVATELFMTPTAELCDYVLPATSFLEMGNLAAGFEHRPQGKVHLQYRPAVVPPLAERRSDIWMIFELAKRVSLGREFWDGDPEAGYEHELEPTGITLA